MELDFEELSDMTFRQDIEHTEYSIWHIFYLARKYVSSNPDPVDGQIHSIRFAAQSIWTQISSSGLQDPLCQGESYTKVIEVPFNLKVIIIFF